MNTSSLYSHYSHHSHAEKPRRKLTLPKPLYGWALLFLLFSLFFGMGQIVSGYMSPLIFSSPEATLSK